MGGQRGRGQQGSEAAMAAGAAIGARVVFLTGAECRLDVADWEQGLELEWRAWRGSLDDPGAWDGEVNYTAVAARMWSPAHLRASWSGDDLAFDWIRRARKGGDAWGPGESPNEAAEAYRIRIFDGDRSDNSLYGGAGGERFSRRRNGQCRGGPAGH